MSKNKSVQKAMAEGKSEMTDKSSLILNGEVKDSNDEINTGEEKLSAQKEEYRLLIPDGQAEKISPKAIGSITWQLAISEEENQLYLRLVANGSGGLFSKDWVSLTQIADVLETQPVTGFTSGVFKPLFKGASANNAGFLAAVLRSPDICLLEAHPDKLFTHVLYPDWRERLNKLALFKETEEATRD